MFYVLPKQKRQLIRPSSIRTAGRRKHRYSELPGEVAIASFLGGCWVFVSSIRSSLALTMHDEDPEDTTILRQESTQGHLLVIFYLAF
jgi:hypothetical protein